MNGIFDTGGATADVSPTVSDTFCQAVHAAYPTRGMFTITARYTHTGAGLSSIRLSAASASLKIFGSRYLTFRGSAAAIT